MAVIFFTGFACQIFGAKLRLLQFFVNFGIFFRQDQTSPRQRVLYHNTIAGLNAVNRLAEQTCECISKYGSCSQQICWTPLPDPEKTGNHLLNLYDQATYRIRYKQRRFSAQDERFNAESSYKPSKETIQTRINNKLALVYRVKKLDFCRANPKNGIETTTGRECTLEPGTGEYHCGKLCCNRGFDTESKNVKKECNCKYVWWENRIDCEECDSVETKYFCK